jgi:hypothetical protein
VLAYPYTEGQTVTYHGSVTDRRGRTYRAWLCSCRRAHAVEQPRFKLTDPDTGRTAAWHVRPTSLTPT